ncbi:MAG: 4a-hydroxytetrahydrobiopterin dehydratase [Candidatus Sericytochromatia bacterium]
MSHALSSAEIETALQQLPGWTYTEQALQKQFVCENFREAISFIVRLSFHAEELNHHPELKNVYNQVDIRLTTHDAGNQVTAKDLELAQAIEGFNWISRG